jgi:hypothetical protein
MEKSRKYLKEKNEKDILLWLHMTQDKPAKSKSNSIPVTDRCGL